MKFLRKDEIDNIQKHGEYAKITKLRATKNKQTSSLEKTDVSYRFDCLIVGRPCRKRQKEQLLNILVLITMVGNLGFLKKYSTPTIMLSYSHFTEEKTGSAR